MPSKAKNVTWYKKKVWTEVSKYIRLTHSHQGNCICYTCGKVMPIKKSQAGHAFSGRGNAILFELDGIRPQCYGCNCCSSGKLDEFAYRLRNELGNKRYEELYRLKHSERKYSIGELMVLLDDYRAKVKKLEG